jgi:magnesium transporter
VPVYFHPSRAEGVPAEPAAIAGALATAGVWLDLVRPSTEEVQAVERELGINLPTREEMREIEITSRLYCEDGARFMTTPLLVSTETDAPESTEITFVFVRQCLLTIRDADPQSFRAIATQFARKSLTTRDQVFVALIEAIVDRQADLLERISKETEDLSQRIFARIRRVKESETNLREAIFRLGRSGDLIARERDCIVSLSRLVQYAGQEDFDDTDNGRKSPLYPRLKPVIRDLQSLSEFAGFLANKINFMLDATLGLINIEQNAIVKIFTVAAVIFLPPTLVASAYGMNFANMPELKWEFGYPFAILLMFLSVLIPYWYCRRKGWL